MRKISDTVMYPVTKFLRNKIKELHSGINLDLFLKQSFLENSVTNVLMIIHSFFNIPVHSFAIYYAEVMM